MTQVGLKATSIRFGSELIERLVTIEGRSRASIVIKWRRPTLAAFGERVCTMPEPLGALGQNLKREQVLTSFSYGRVAAMGSR